MEATSDDLFVNALKGSLKHLQTIQRWLLKREFFVTSMPIAIRPDVSQREEYADNGDMVVGVRAEGKQLSYEFTSREDWPFEHFIVMSKPSYDKAIIKPQLFYYLSRSGRCIASVTGNSRKHWYVQSRTDTRPGRCASCLYYFVPLEYVQFHKIDDD